jgi:hypothetical protein
MESTAKGSATSSSRTGHSGVWKRLWALKIPNVGKKIMWKACREILPTRSNLHKRKIIEDLLCPSCGRDPETTLRVLWHCPSAMVAWSVSNVKIQKKSSTTGQNFQQLMEEILVPCDEKEVQQFVGIARSWVFHMSTQRPKGMQRW